MEKHIELIKTCILEKDSPMQVAHTRLATRTHRPKIESCRDLVQHRYDPTSSFLADRTATQYDRLLASSCRPSVCL